MRAEEATRRNERDYISHAIFLAKGFTITVVVMGHYGPVNWWPKWFYFLECLMYLFIMPLFAMASGYLNAHDLISVKSGKDFKNVYYAFLYKRLLRLLVPYFTVQLMYIIIKTSMQSFFAYQPITITSLVSILILPSDAPASLMWFVYALIVISILFPVLRHLVKNDILLLLFAASCFMINQAPQLFALAHVSSLLVFYTFGDVLYRRKLLSSTNSNRWMVGSIPIFIISSALFFLIHKVDDYIEFRDPFRLVAAISCCMIILSGFILFARRSANWDNSLLRTIGFNSNIVYYLHQPIVWGIAVLLHEYFQLSSEVYILGQPIAIVLGVFAPILIQNSIIKNNKMLTFAFNGQWNGRKSFRTPIDRYS